MWQDFFYFSKTEKRGIVVLMLLCIVLLAAPYFWPDASNDEPTDFSAFQETVANWQEASNVEEPLGVEAIIPALFDPNAPKKEVLAALNLSERAIRAWMSYTAKGGRFRHPVDLDKFRALTDKERQRVKPYLSFPETAQEVTQKEEFSREVPSEKAPLSNFDPNYITQAELLSFGVPRRAAANWIKFLEAGGRFNKAADIGKIYGLPTEWQERLLPFVEVATTPTRQSSPNQENSKPKTSNYASVTIDINQATAEEWAKLYGIGPTLSKRIINFRNKLGGFYRLEQVNETYGLPDSTFQRILPQLKLSALLRTLNINDATEQELAAHPYINRNSAKLIVNYRRQHGPFKVITDLDKLYGLETGFAEKIKPYVTFE